MGAKSSEQKWWLYGIHRDNSEIIQLLNLHGAESSKKNDDLIIEFWNTLKLLNEWNPFK